MLQLTANQPINSVERIRNGSNRAKTPVSRLAGNNGQPDQSLSDHHHQLASGCLPRPARAVDFVLQLRSCGASLADAIGRSLRKQVAQRFAPIHPVQPLPRAMGRNHSGESAFLELAEAVTRAPRGR
jgi:hypothetical protein